jgi:hypothetical protein
VKANVIGTSAKIREYFQEPGLRLTVRGIFARVEYDKPGVSYNQVSALVSSLVTRGELRAVRHNGKRHIERNPDYARPKRVRAKQIRQRETAWGLWPALRVVLDQAEDSLDLEEIVQALRARGTEWASGYVNNVLSERHLSGEVIANRIDGRRCYTLAPTLGGGK